MTILDRSVLLGEQQPRLLLQPERVSSAAEEAIELAESAGLILDEWQRIALEVSLGERVDGKWSAFEVGLLVARQNGKGGVLEARELAGLFLFGENLILHSAHEFKTAKEAFYRMRNLIDSCGHLSRLVKQVRQANDEVSIELRSGQRLRYLARSSGGGRGFTGDCVILDEAYKLDPEAMAALLPTMSARPNPQIWYTSSAPLSSSLVLHRLRKRAITAAADDDRLAFLEWSAPDGCDTDDRGAWAAANPALGIRIDPEFIAAERNALTESTFRRERLGIPDMADGDAVGTIPPADWSAAAGEASGVTPGVFAVAVAPDQSWACIGSAGFNPDGLVHVGVVEYQRGTAWLAGRLGELTAKWSCPVVVNPGSPVGSVTGVLTVVEASSRELMQWCSSFLDGVTGHTVKHLNQPELNISVANGVRQDRGDGWVWSSRKSSVEISPLWAVTMAHGYLTAGKNPELKPVFAF